MKRSSAIVVLAALPFFLGMHCRRDCATVVESAVAVAHSPSIASPKPFPLDAGKLYEIRLAAGVVPTLSAADEGVVVYRGLTAPAACAALGKRDGGTTVAAGEPPRALPAAGAIEPFAFPLQSGNGTAPEVMSERVFVASLGSVQAMLTASYGGTRPSALTNENIHGQCVDVPYRFLVPPTAVACP